MKVLVKIFNKLRMLVLFVYYRLCFGKQFSFNGSLKFRRRFVVNISTQDAMLVIGNNCFFNNGCSINVRHKVTIGNDCLFGENVCLYDHDHDFSNKDIKIRKQGFICKAVSIGDNCWFGSNVTILKGVTIGSNCIIGAGAVITKDIGDNSVIVAKQNHTTRPIYSE